VARGSGTAPHKGLQHGHEGGKTSLKQKNGRKGERGDTARVPGLNGGGGQVHHSPENINQVFVQIDAGNVPIGKKSSVKNKL